MRDQRWVVFPEGTWDARRIVGWASTNGKVDQCRVHFKGNPEWVLIGLGAEEIDKLVREALAV